MAKPELTKEQRIQMAKVDAVNLDNVGKLLTEESKIIKYFVDNKKPVLDKNGNDMTGRNQAMNIFGALSVVINYLSDRVNTLEADIKKMEETKEE